MVNTSVVFSCTSDALPAAKFRFYRVTGAVESEVSTSSSASTGVLVESSIMHPRGSYLVNYKCVPYNMLGDGPNKTVLVNVRGMRNSIKFYLIKLIAHNNVPPISSWYC